MSLGSTAGPSPLPAMGPSHGVHHHSAGHAGADDGQPPFVICSAYFLLVLIVWIFMDREERAEARRARPAPKSTPLPVVAPRVGPAAAHGAECSICLSVIRKGEVEKVLSLCKHRFHGECAEMWLFTHRTCPVCRALVPAAEVGAAAVVPNPIIV